MTLDSSQTISLTLIVLSVGLKDFLLFNNELITFHFFVWFTIILIKYLMIIHFLEKNLILVSLLL